MKIACIDFETANHSATSICAAGVAVFEDGELRQARHWLVKPPRGHDWFRPDFIGIHGIRPADVRHAPEFPGIADEVLPLLLDADIVVAHNSAFDMKILHRTLEHYALGVPDFRFLCTVLLSRRVWPDLPTRSLGALAALLGHEFQHHNAREDAVAAGVVLLAMMRHGETSSPLDLAATVGLAPGSLSAASGYLPCKGQRKKRRP